MAKLNAYTKLTLVKITHTIIWLVFVAIICFVVWTGWTGNISIYSWLAVTAVIGEGLVLAIFKWKCPLTVIARKYSDSTSDNFDIYLPNWLAKYNKLIFTSIFCIWLAMMLFHVLQTK
jgi:hypothetical protein